MSCHGRFVKPCLKKTWDVHRKKAFHTIRWLSHVFPWAFCCLAVCYITCLCYPSYAGQNQPGFSYQLDRWTARNSVCFELLRLEWNESPEVIKAGTFQKGWAFFDVGTQLFKDAVDLLLSGDEVFERGGVHLSHESLVLLADHTGIGSWENQRHLTRKER